MAALITATPCPQLKKTIKVRSKVLREPALQAEKVDNSLSGKLQLTGISDRAPGMAACLNYPEIRMPSNGLLYTKIPRG